MAELAAQSIYIQGPSAQGFECVTMSLSEERMQAMRQQVSEVIKNFLEESRQYQHTNVPVYQLNVQLFALTRPGMTQEESQREGSRTGQSLDEGEKALAMPASSPVAA